MPRKHRAARERAASPAAERSRSGAPEWSDAPGVQVRAVTGDKVYRCPGCDHEIRPGTPHLVVVPDDDPSDRRHWHLVCWQQELRRRRLRR